MEPEKVEKFRALLQRVKTAAVVTHINPDGDAIGTSLALVQCLQSLGIATTVIVPNPFPEFLHWLEGVEDIMIYKHGQTKAKKVLAAADVIFCVDMNSLLRVEGMGEYIISLPAPRVLIDHHLLPAEEEFLITFSKIEACSSAEVLYHLIKALGLLPTLTATTAECIYTGIMTDTNGFQNNSTRPEIFYIVAELLKCGVNKEKVQDAVYCNYSEYRMRLMGYSVCDKMVVLPEYRTAYIALSQEETARFNFQPGDTEGFVNFPLHIKGIVLSAFISENQDNVRISFRSRGKFSVNDFARNHFNGGGHLNAAGGVSELSVSKTVEKFVDILQDYKHELSAL